MTIAPEELDALRASLSDRLPWTPLDFLRHLPATVERSREARRLTTPLPESDDFRLLAQAADGTPVAVLAERLPWDSDFFGYGVARLNGIYPVDTAYNPRLDLADAVGRLLHEARSRDIRYLFAMVDPRDLALLRALGAQGFANIETRAHYHAAVSEFTHSERYATRLATDADIPPLARTAREMANPYDRFHADPAIARDHADRLMEEWVRNSIAGGFADATLIPDHPVPEALITIRYHREQWAQWGSSLAQVAFTVVGHSFKGWFHRLMVEAMYRFRDEGISHAYYTTQVTNGAVLHVLTKLGFAFGRAEHVFRKLL